MEPIQTLAKKEVETRVGKTQRKITYTVDANVISLCEIGKIQTKFWFGPNEVVRIIDYFRKATFDKESKYILFLVNSYEYYLKEEDYRRCNEIRLDLMIRYFIDPEEIIDGTFDLI